MARVIGPHPKRPSRILGPWRSWRMPMCTPISWETWRIVAMRAACSLWSPWEKLSLKVVAPASIS